MANESLHSSKLVKNKKTGQSTQSFLDIEQIKDGVVILKNGALRAVLMVSSINFDLKSADEQDAIIGYYQNFLNSLDFPVQIFINSRKVNLANYIKDLRILIQEQTNELLRLQMEDYINYITYITKETDIVNKKFYIVIPFSPVENKKSGIKEKIFELLSPKSTIRAKDKKSFEVYKDQLWQRVEHVQYGLNGVGIRMVALSTQELIELYYSVYNPREKERLGVASVEELAVNTSRFG
jgi:hypothetical protein